MIGRDLMTALEMLSKISQDAKEDVEEFDSAPETEEEFLSDDEIHLHPTERDTFSSILSADDDIPPSQMLNKDV